MCLEIGNWGSNPTAYRFLESRIWAGARGVWLPQLLTPLEKSVECAQVLEVPEGLTSSLRGHRHLLPWRLVSGEKGSGGISRTKMSGKERRVGVSLLTEFADQGTLVHTWDSLSRKRHLSACPVLSCFIRNPARPVQVSKRTPPQSKIIHALTVPHHVFKAAIFWWIEF